MTPKDETSTARYSKIIDHVFLSNYQEGSTTVPFTRDDLVEAASALNIELPKNVGDIVYSMRYRSELPDAIKGKAPEGRVWIIEGAGRSLYRFKCVALAFIEPSKNLARTKILDSTPGIIEKYRLSDEQALLAKLRYNRLIDTFLGITCYSLQNHLRTTVPEVGQVETDEVYVGVDKVGAHYVVPVQAKGGNDRLSAVQIKQDIDLCKHRFPVARSIPVAAQFMSEDVIALFAFDLQDGQPVITSERQYLLVANADLSEDELIAYSERPE